MRAELTSGNYKIITSNIVFFYEDDITITLYDDNGTKDITIRIELINNPNCEKETIETRVINNELHLKCINFLNKSSNSGIIRPTCIAESDTGKKMYIMFWIQREGNSGYMRTNTLKYTIFQEK